jgi:methionine synthase I (cobalamin-dependent)
MQKNAEHVNEFCRCCNASLKVTYRDTWKSVSIVNLLKPTVGQNSFEVLLQNIGIVCERGPEWSERLCRTMHENKMCILNLYFPFSSPRLNDVRLVYNKSNQTITQMTT